MVRWLNSLQPWGVVLLRLVVGFSLLYHGWSKVTPFSMHNPLAPEQAFCRHIAAMGLPFWMGYISVFSEVVGGAALLVGLFVRFFALLAAGNMVFAMVLVTRHRGYEGSELPLMLFAMSVMLLLTGPGRLAIDRRLGLI
ncbi:MAG TPA: DoxX family protein [Granulicella sp.]